MLEQVDEINYRRILTLAAPLVGSSVRCNAAVFGEETERVLLEEGVSRSLSV